MGHAIPFVLVATRPRTRLARLGDWMARHRSTILALQWAVVGVYALLVVLPALLPLPPESATIASDLTRFAQFAFWGIWWPCVIVSMMAVGRLWCGLLCPEGALAEFASRHGRGGAIPRWVRWSGWPLVGFLLTTLYGQLISVYEYPRPVLLILGGSTLAAIVAGLAWGRGKRVWCRYLCPVSGVFGLLARIAPVAFVSDQAAWARHPARTPAVDCAPLLNVRTLSAAAHCHNCGRCSGHRDAVSLRWRWPSAEILASRPADVSLADVLLLLYGMLGFALGAFLWTLAPAFVTLKQGAAEWLVEHELFWPLADDAPWWLLTHYPEASDVFSWLDGAAIVVFIVAHALVIGGIAQSCLVAAARLARMHWRVLALALVPLAGASLFLGLSMLTLGQLRAEGIEFPWIPALRAALLGAGVLASAWLAARIVLRERPTPWRALAAWLLVLVAMAPPLALWAGALGPF